MAKHRGMTLVDDFWLIQPGMNTPWNCELLWMPQTDASKPVASGIHRSKVRLVVCNVSSRKPVKNSRSQLRIWGWYGKLQLVIWNEQTEIYEHNTTPYRYYCQEAQMFEKGDVQQTPACKRVTVAHICATCKINSLFWEHYNDPKCWPI